MEALGLKSWLLIGVALFAAPGVAHASRAHSALVRDPALEKRLVETRKYVVHPGDTLRSVAKLLYGHETWWVRVKKDNRHVFYYGPDEKLPIGLALKYRAPKLGDQYVVQPGDWLIRIALWKFGSKSQWEEIYQRNAKTIRDANLIHPGDQLKFEDDGTIVNEYTGRVVLRGNEVLEVPFDQDACDLPAPEPKLAFLSDLERAPAAADSPSMASLPEARYVALGFLAGLLVLFVYLKRAPGEDVSFETESSRTFGGVMGSAEPGLRTDLDQVENVDELRKELDRRPGYHSLLPKRLKKYLK